MTTNSIILRACQCLAFSLAFFLTESTFAGPATLHVQRSDQVGTIRPSWYVSRRVRADVTEENLNDGSEPTDRIRRWVQDDVGCPINDDAGHYVARVLGGLGNIHRNIFPENRNLNRGRQSQWEMTVADYLVDECDEVRVTITVGFDDNATPETRPVSVRYRARCVGNVTPGGRRSLQVKNWQNDLPANCP